MRNLSSTTIWLLLVLAAPTFADDPYFKPTSGNRYVTTTDKYLYLVWSVPRDLRPIQAIATKEAREAFMARTALSLCVEHKATEPSGTKPCKVQVVRMNTNDEYTKSAAGGFKTIAEFILPAQANTADTLTKALLLALPDLKALFTRFEVKHDRMQQGGP